MRIFKRILTAVDMAITWPIYFLSLLIPRSKRTWVFIGWHRSSNMEIFADNTKYLFLYVSQNIDNVKAIWLSKDKKLAKSLRGRGYHSYYENSLMGIFYALISKYTFIDAFLQRQNFRWTGQSKIVQLLHGKGMKKGGYSEKQLRNQNYIFGSSQFSINLLPDSFKIRSKIFVTGYSRDDVLKHDIDDSDISISEETKDFLESIRRDPKTKVLWYAPTFRRNEKRFDIEKNIDPNNTNVWLEKNNLFLFVSLHPKYREQTRSLSYSRIIFFEESDVYPIMKLFDILITDYSSIFTDFVLLDRPIIFYPYDINAYEKNEGFSFNYDEHTPGPKAYGINELQEVVEKTLTEDSYTLDRNKIRESYHKYFDGNSSRRIIEILSREEKLDLL